MTTYPTIVLNTYLIALLNREGIAVNPGAAIAIFKIINRHQESQQGNFSTLKYLITPILSRTREEQQKIYDILDHLDEKFQQIPSLPEIETPQPVIFQPEPPYRKLLVRSASFLRHNWIPLSLFLLVAAAALWYYLVVYTPFKAILSVEVPPIAVVGEPVQFDAGVNDTAHLSSYHVQWQIGPQKDSGWTLQKTFAVAGIIPVHVYLVKDDILLDSFISQLNVNCEPVPSVSIQEIPAVAAALNPSKKNNGSRLTVPAKAAIPTSTGKRKKTYEPVFQNASRDSAQYGYRWYVNDVLRGTAKLFTYTKQQREYNTIRLVVDANGTHCNTDSLTAQHQENKALGYAHISGKQPLILQKTWNTSNLLSSLFYLLVLPIIVAGTLYFIRRKLWFRAPEITPWKNELPHTFAFSNAEHLIHRDPGIRYLADILRKRQVTSSQRMDIPRTIRLSMRTWGLPQLAFEQGSSASEFLVLLDREYGEGHMTCLFTYLCQQLNAEQVNVVLYDYYKQPLLLNSQTLQHQLVPADRLAALYPGATLIIFGQSIHFVSSLKNTLKPWVTEKFRHWDKKIFITGYASNDWDKKESLLSQAGFFVIPSDLTTLPLLESYLFDNDISQRLLIPRAYSSRYLSFDSANTLQEYFHGQPKLFQWVCALATYPAPNWQVTLRIGNTLEEFYHQQGDEEKLVTYTNLLKLSRISWMQDGNRNESLKADLLARLPKDIQVVVREALNSDIQTIINTLPDGSVAKEELKNYHRLNAFLIDAYQQKTPTLKNTIAVQQLLASDQVDAAHKIYLDNEHNSVLHVPGKPHESIDTDTYIRQMQKPARRKLLTEALTVLLVFSVLALFILQQYHQELLQWKKILPATKSVTLMQQLAQPQTLYANMVIGNRQHRIAFTRDTVITFEQVPVTDTSEMMFFQFSADTVSRMEYDSFALHSSNDTLIATEPTLIPVTLITSDPTGSFLADSLEQALPSNFIVERMQSVQTDTGIVIRYSDSLLLDQAQYLNAIILRLFNQTGTISLFNAQPRLNGIRVFLGGRRQIIIPKSPKTKPVSLDTSIRNNNNYENPAPANTRTAGWYFEQGQQMYQQNRYAESIQYFDSSIRLNPKDPLAYYNRALGYEQLRQYTAALNDYQVAININPDDALSTFRKAEIEFDQKEYNAAIQDYSRVISINSSYITTTNFIAYYKRGEAYRLTNNLEKACEDYQTADKGGNREAGAAITNYCSVTPENPISNLKILWIGTNPEITQSIRDRIQSSGNKVTTISDPSSSRKYLGGYPNNIDVVIYTINAKDYDDKSAVDLLNMQDKINFPLIVFYYQNKNEIGYFNKKASNISIVRSEQELMKALSTIIKPQKNYLQKAKK